MRLLRAAWPLLLLISIGALLLASGVGRHVQPERLLHGREVLLGHVSGAPILSALVFIALMSLSIATAVPGVVLLVLAGGMVFGAWPGGALSLCGVLAGGSILFAASRRTFQRSQAAPPALALRLRDGFHRHPFSYTMFLRLLPLFPFGAVTVALAWLRCSWPLFLSTCLLGGSLPLALQSHLGAGLVEVYARSGVISVGLLANPQILLPLLGLAVLALLPIAISRYQRSRQQAAP